MFLDIQPYYSNLLFECSCRPYHNRMYNCHKSVDNRGRQFSMDDGLGFQIREKFV